MFSAVSQLATAISGAELEVWCKLWRGNHGGVKVHLAPSTSAKLLSLRPMTATAKLFSDPLLFNSSSSLAGFENAGNEDGGFFLTSIDTGTPCR